MARARNIKPGFFTHEQMAENDPLGRLLFIGLTTIADYKGDVEWRPKRIKIQLLPYDECNIEKLAINLDRSGFIRFYSVGEKIYLHVVNFEKHQNPHKNERESGSEIPAHTEEMRQAVDLNTLTIKSELIAINREQNGTDPADSLIPHPSSLIPHPSSLIPDSIKNTIVDNKPSTPACPHQEIIDLYHEHCPTMTQIRVWTDKRQKALQARWREDEKHQTLDFWKRFFRYVSQSDFLKGSDGGWQADLEWLVTSSNFVKVIEGKYHGEKAA